MKAEPNKVIEEIILLRSKMGYSSTALVSYLKDTYDINVTRAYELIKLAREKMGEIYNQVNTDVLKDSILFMENQRQKAVGEGNLKLALEIQKELNKVNQLYIERSEVNITGNIDVRKLFGFEDDVKPDDKKEGDTK
jgi:hypothetical protein